MEIDLEGIVIIVGNYGSGKTEVSVNLAVNRREAGLEVRLADLDLVNPYFRTREAREALARFGIEVVLPADKYLQADLPLLTPAISGMLRKPARLTLLDVGGDDAGATVLASLADSLVGKRFRMLQVVNPFRPFTNSVSGCMKIRREIESASRMMIDGIIGNPNLIDETVPEDIYAGYELVSSLSKESGLPLELVTVPDTLMQRTDPGKFSCPVLPIARQLVPPWKKAVELGKNKLRFL
jgi:hypothetical protein